MRPAPERPLRPGPSPEDADEVLDPEVRELVEHLRRTGRRPDPDRRRQLREMPILDLHGFRADDAGAELRRFLQTWVVGGARWARVVTGRGRHSAGLTVVRDVAEAVLAGSPLVASYERAGPDYGGAGVLLVHLRRAPSARP